MAIIYSYTSLKRGRNKEQLRQSSDSNKSIAATGMELRPGEVSTVEGKSGKKERESKMIIEIENMGLMGQGNSANEIA